MIGKKVHLGGKVTLIGEEIKPVAIAIVKIRLSESISQSVAQPASWSVSQSVGRSVSRSIGQSVS